MTRDLFSFSSWIQFRIELQGYRNNFKLPLSLIGFLVNTHGSYMTRCYHYSHFCILTEKQQFHQGNQPPPCFDIWTDVVLCFNQLSRSSTNVTLFLKPLLPFLLICNNISFRWYLIIVFLQVRSLTQSLTFTKYSPEIYASCGFGLLRQNEKWICEIIMMRQTTSRQFSYGSGINTSNMMSSYFITFFYFSSLQYATVAASWQEYGY